MRAKKKANYTTEEEEDDEEEDDGNDNANCDCSKKHVGFGLFLCSPAVPPYLPRDDCGAASSHKACTQVS